MSDTLLLLKAFLLSTSQRNIYRHTKDRKKKAKIIGGWIGSAFLYLLLLFYSVFMCIGYGEVGLIGAAPMMCALILSALAFLFTFLKTNGYLFNFREYDMIMSLPFAPKTVASCKFLYMYLKSLPWYLSISIAMMAGYGYYTRPAVYVYPLWLILSMILPVIPMLMAAFIGFLIARISSGFKKTNLIQTVLSFAFIILSFCLRFILQALFHDGNVEQSLSAVSKATEEAGRYYPPARWFSDAITKSGISDALLLFGVSLLLFAILFQIVGRSYREINSALRSHAASRRFRMKEEKPRSQARAIAFKEYRRMVGSTPYITNLGVGFLMALLLGVVTLVIGFDEIVAVIVNNAPFDPLIAEPAIPLIVYFLVGMVPTTVCSPSLEGKNYWIVKSLPIDPRTLYQGKMLFHMMLAVPFMEGAILCLCISAKTPVIDTILYLMLGFTLCAFSTAWGCVCGLKHMRLDWENEIEVIKQGTAVTVYLLPNMFVSMALIVLVVILGMRMNHLLVTLILILISAVLAALSYLRVMKLAMKNT